jgi:hypothetical protein
VRDAESQMHFESCCKHRSLQCVTVAQVCLTSQYMNPGLSPSMYFSHCTQLSRALSISIPDKRGTTILKNKFHPHYKLCTSQFYTALSLLTVCKYSCNKASHYILLHVNNDVCAESAPPPPPVP